MRPKFLPFPFYLFPLPCRQNGGYSLIEVMFAMLILATAVLGVTGAFQWADRGLQQGAKGTRALAMAESRLEAKRAAPWRALLTDDLDADGTPEVTMRDDGTPPDQQAGDRVYTASTEAKGITLTWTVQPDRSGPLARAGSAVIRATATYSVGPGQPRQVQVGTLRANPNYVGMP